MQLFKLMLLALSALLALLSASPAAAQETWSIDPALLERARAILKQVPVIDTHNDLPYSVQELLNSDATGLNLRVRQPEHPADIPRLREGMVGAQFWSAYVASDSMHSGGSLRTVLNAIAIVHDLARRYPDVFEMAGTAADIERIEQTGKIASLIGVEGGHALEGSLLVLPVFHKLGVRYMTLTHFLNTPWADAATDFPRHHGLTEFGEQVVREMNRVGIFVDLSHVSAETMHDALRVTQAPVIFSHSSSRAINTHPRNVPDEVLTLLPKNGGVVMVNFIASYIPRTGPAWALRRDSVAERIRAQTDNAEALAQQLEAWIKQNPAPRGTVADVADHIDHIRKVAGIDHIGIGSDYYQGSAEPMSIGLEDPSKYPNLFAELLKRGYTDEELKKIAGLNLLRAMKQMERTAANLQAAELTGAQRPRTD
jgi:membrane dipeptidase